MPVRISLLLAEVANLLQAARAISAYAPFLLIDGAHIRTAPASGVAKRVISQRLARRTPVRIEVPPNRKVEVAVEEVHRLQRAAASRAAAISAEARGIGRLRVRAKQRRRRVEGEVEVVREVAALREMVEEGEEGVEAEGERRRDRWTWMMMMKNSEFCVALWSEHCIVHYTRVKSSLNSNLRT